jgi:hypothetical protein
MGACALSVTREVSFTVAGGRWNIWSGIESLIDVVMNQVDNSLWVFSHGHRRHSKTESRVEGGRFEEREEDYEIIN